MSLAGIEIRILCAPAHCPAKKKKKTLKPSILMS